MATFTKILAATDFSDDSTYALDYAEELARKFSAEILVMHVDQPLAPVMVSELSPGLDVGAMNRIAEEQRLLALRELDRTTARLRDAGLKSRGLLKVGAPFLEIINAAHVEGADLMVEALSINAVLFIVSFAIFLGLLNSARRAGSLLQGGE